MSSPYYVLGNLSVLSISSEVLDRVYSFIWHLSVVTLSIEAKHIVSQTFLLWEVIKTKKPFNLKGCVMNFGFFSLNCFEKRLFVCNKKTTQFWVKAKFTSSMLLNLNDWLVYSVYGSLKTDGCLIILWQLIGQQL